MVGLRGKPIGIKASVYNPNEVTEYGAFLYIDAMNWEKKKEELSKRKSEGPDPLPMIEKYHLDYILKRAGWDIIRNALNLNTNPNKVEIMGVKIMKGVSWTDQFENIVNSDSIFKYFREKDGKEE